MMCPFVLPFDITSNTSNVTFKSLGKLRCDINIPENPAEIVKEKPPQDIQRYKLLHPYTPQPVIRCVYSKRYPHILWSIILFHPFFQQNMEMFGLSRYPPNLGQIQMVLGWFLVTKRMSWEKNHPKISPFWTKVKARKTWRVAVRPPWSKDAMQIGFVLFEFSNNT